MRSALCGLLLFTTAVWAQAAEESRHAVLGLFMTEGGAYVDVCGWATDEPTLDPSGGRLHATYRRAPSARDLSCAEYYALVRRAFAHFQTRKAQGAQLDPYLIWQCWWDDPCACEVPRS